MKRFKKNLCPLILIAFLMSCSNQANNHKNSANNELAKYELVNDWPQLPEGLKLGQVTGIGIDTSQHILLIHRAGRVWKLLNETFPDSLISSNTILEIENESGKIINSWGANLFIMPHGLNVDKENNIWITDVGLQQIFKFRHDGKLLMTLGVAKIAGNDSLHFNYPTDVAVTDDGSFYVSDGYRNSRVIKFSKSGKYLFEWGTKGNKPGEFEIPHAIDLDEKGNVYVADRENKRIQKFDSTGKFLKEWQNNTFEKMYSVAINKKNQHLLAVDYLIVNDTLIKGSDIIEFDSTGNLEMQFGRIGLYDGPVSRYHDIAVDNEGSIYVGDILGNRIQKFRKISH
jgi:peptidylamidoglycolate lyase